MLVKRGHEGGLCRTIVCKGKVIVQERVAQVKVEGSFVTVVRGMSLVDREVPIHEQGFQETAATKIAQASVGSSNVTSPLHHRPRVKQTQPPTEAKGIRAREKGPNVLQVQCAADSDKGIRHAEGTLQTDNIPLPAHSRVTMALLIPNSVCNHCRNCVPSNSHPGPMCDHPAIYSQVLRSLRYS